MLAKIKANILPEIACFIGSKYLLMIRLAPNIILGACFKQACTLYKLNAEISKNAKVGSCESTVTTRSADSFLLFSDFKKLPHNSLDSKILSYSLVIYILLRGSKNWLQIHLSQVFSRKMVIGQPKLNSTRPQIPFFGGAKNLLPIHYSPSIFKGSLKKLAPNSQNNGDCAAQISCDPPSDSFFWGLQKFTHNSLEPETSFFEGRKKAF